MKVLGIDPGEKRIGVAVSDPTGNLARPLSIIEHASRSENASKIAQLAVEQDVNLIIIGQALNPDGTPSFSGRRAARLAGALRAITTTPVILWDESYSTKEAKKFLLEMGVSQKKRRGHQDEHAAAVILQSYLDFQARK